MTTRGGWAVAVAVVFAGVFCFALYSLTQWLTPRVDPALRQAALPVIDDYLESAHPPMGAAARWFCGVQIIEARREGAEIQVGVVARCGGFSRSGDRLVSWGVDRSPMLVILDHTAGRYVIQEVRRPPHGANAVIGWVRGTFSRPGAATVFHEERAGWPNLPDPAAEARRAFGLTAVSPGP